MAAPEGPQTIQLQILSDAHPFPYEKTFTNQRLADFKARLETIVGIEVPHMKLELRTADGRFFSSLTNDKALLSELNVENKMIIFVHNTGGAASEFDDVSKVEKYEMDSEAYDARENTVRAWKKKILAEKGAGEAESLEGLAVGDSCIVQAAKQPDRRAKIAFLGTTQFSEGNWIGVIYEGPVGKNDGSVNGVRYFTCENLHGGFVKPRSVVPVPQEEEMEEI
uniref:CAP-Gly domain-containing protein n=1 Tax=Steinernema glaseri TaxID=37863 RepID=A0A1I7YK50_9BILA